MDDQDAVARNRWFLIVVVRLAGVVGAVFGLVLIGRVVALEQKLLGMAIVLSALVVIAVVPRSLARRWRTPPER